MAATFRLQVATPEKPVFSGQARSLVAPGAEGYFGVLANHAPMVALLAVGDLTVWAGDGTETHVAVNGGVLEVSGNSVTVLADTAELASQIDEQRAQRALERARKRLEEHAPDTDRARAQAALARALNRLRVKQR